MKLLYVDWDRKKALGAGKTTVVDSEGWPILYSTQSWRAFVVGILDGADAGTEPSLNLK